MGKRENLIAKIYRQYEEGATDPVYPVVGLDEFFDGNTEEASIAPNRVGYWDAPIF